MNLSVEQKSFILGFWKNEDFNWLFEIGMKIYSEIFRLNPSVKNIFPYIVNCEKQHKDIKESNQFRIQALRFVQILSLAVGSIAANDPKLEDFDRNLYRLGQRHKKFVEINGFKAEYWDMFKNACIRIIEMEYKNEFTSLSEKNLKTAIDGWETICDYIVAGMMKGFSDNGYSIPVRKCVDFGTNNSVFRSQLDSCNTVCRKNSTTCVIS